MSGKYKKTSKYLNYAEHLLILVSTVTSSVVGLKICAITVGIKMYKSIIDKKKRNHDKLVLLGKVKLNTMEVLISKVLMDLCISHN